MVGDLGGYKLTYNVTLRDKSLMTVYQVSYPTPLSFHG